MPASLHKLVTLRLMHAAVVAVAAATALALTACGAGMNRESSQRGMDEATAHAPVQPAPSDPHAFAWLHAAPAPHAWRSTDLPNGAARMAYPPAWKPIRTDPGAVTSALRDSDGDIVGYLNATPQQSSETLANWAAFRPDHNADEGDRNLRPIAAATDLRFRSGHGSCLIEDYRTSSGHPYREVACIVAGSQATTVIVGAAPPEDWSRQGPAIERAISSFLT